MNTDFNIGSEIVDWVIEPIFECALPNVVDFRGKPLIILLFSLHCPGCIGRAIPFANRLVYENEDKINVIGIHTHFEGPEKTQNELESAKTELFIRFPYYKDAGFAETFHIYQAGGTPHWIIVDKNGIIIESIFGSDPNRALLRIDLHLKQLIL
ncbi:MAG: redoxin domain-containing protein [Chitinophagaceae bacterium]|jgi:thiol-disulfide isomerase/thioredoxin|nr:redoxin domain-containing protein [Chitinophagaceae bacterium]